MTDGEDIGEDAEPETIMDAALTSGPPPKKNQPPTILPTVELQQDDVLAKGKTEATENCNTNPRILNTLKIMEFIKKHEEFSLDEVLSKEMDPVFLRQLLEDILDSQESSLDAEKGGISPDPALAALAAAPSCRRRGNAGELFARIPHQW